jgi:methylthioribose-1-phosphate isomerase
MSHTAKQNHAVIADNVGGHLMQHGMVDLVITGADRVLRNGDVCNKIGTYLKALAAKDNGVPMVVALPSRLVAHAAQHEGPMCSDVQVCVLLCARRSRISHVDLRSAVGGVALHTDKRIHAHTSSILTLSTYKNTLFKKHAHTRTQHPHNHHNSTIDWKLNDGVQDIPIERRDAHEVKFVRGPAAPTRF